MHPQPGYPFALALAIEYTLSQGGLRVRTTATNVGTDPCPFGCGAHPVPHASAPARRLGAPARSRRARCCCPTSAASPSAPARSTAPTTTSASRRPIGATSSTHAFTDLERDRDGLARVELRLSRSRRRQLALWVDERYPYLMLFTGDDRPDVDRRSLAVEPMTCPPNAFRSGDALIVLEPGDSFDGVWGIAPLCMPRWRPRC